LQKQASLSWSDILDWKPPSSESRFRKHFSLMRWWLSEVALLRFWARMNSFDVASGIDPRGETLRRTLPTGIGSALVPTVLVGASRPNHIRPAIVFPVQWVIESDLGGDQQLAQRQRQVPAKLIELSKCVASQLCESPSIQDHYPRQRLDAERYRLVFADVDDWGEADFSDFPIQTPDSAWAALAFSLLTKIGERTCQPVPSATGVYDPELGRWSVSETLLEAKLSEVIESGSTLFAVPSPVYEKACRCLDERVKLAAPGEKCHRMELVELKDDHDLAAAVGPLLHRTNQPPADDAPIAVKNRYYATLPNDADADRYYRTRLLPQVVNHARTHLPPQALDRSLPQIVVSIVSFTAGLAEVVDQLLCPQRTYLIHTPNLNKKAKELCDVLAENRSQREMPGQFVFFIEVSDDVAGLDAITQEVASIERQPGQLVLDATPGRRAMGAAAEDGLGDGDQLWYWYNENQNRRPVPFSIVPRIYEICNSGARLRLNLSPTANTENHQRKLRDQDANQITLSRD